MSLVHSIPDSNAPKPDGKYPDNNAAGDSVGMLGYSVIPFPSQKPAQSNADVTITQDQTFNNVNEGTSLPSYDQQPDEVSSETGS